MKFAVLALIGSVSAMGSRWGYEDMPEIMEAEFDLIDYVGGHQRELFKAGRASARDAVGPLAKRVMKNDWEKYFPELEALGQSKAVAAKNAHEQKMMQSP